MIVRGYPFFVVVGLISGVERGDTYMKKCEKGYIGESGLRQNS